MVKELDDFKVGDEVELIVADPLVHNWIIKRGMVGKPLIVTAVVIAGVHILLWMVGSVRTLTAMT